ncbi:Pyruvate/2-oxoglutarate dehydrogenase complex, dihydrolipoamide acyltransferase (E2) component or related enzyme [Halanaeroarchaeum sp. HSR-CO]|uniref:dihydrolipoamide acetyltransferase family protein n=1 Tax=Halanaeroarchaeum sp. HSR-CO TaxID=2866382 RepID=UPI00217D02FD|nr:dihydrolipoamide acetyltransferase family protein [Halanaeroarchaeum sp. HSR-CO]UWG48946.1 Pyruvate/2-oxoglutarate dehydrogenase complex, dihydrolipoamide acyltransferase (E2) component or related enzyme [Halanaeroarchaeum sp. HSR-CO]
MPREFKLPDVGEGVAEGEIVSWLVEVGDPVSEDQPVAEVETDKAVVEVPSPVNGTVQELHYEAGTMVEVGEVIVTFALEGEDVAAAPAPTDDSDGKAAEAPADADAAETADAETAVESAPDTGGRTFAPPSVRTLARELDVDIGAVSGTGPSGRVTESDVRAAADGETVGEATEEKPAAEPAAEPGTTAETPPSSEPAADRDRTLAAPATRGVAKDLDVDIDQVPAVERRDGEAFVTADAVREYAEGQQAAQAADVATVAAGETGPREERIPYKGVRKTIGDKMEESKYTAPHVTHHDTVDVTELVAMRERLKPHAEAQDVRLTYMPFVMKAVVAALKEFPELNSSLDEEAGEVVRKHYYNIGVAVATEAGLMVPVVDDVDAKSVLEIAEEVNRLAEEARERTIALEDLQGSTFSITNFGAIGGEYATPIINYPEVGILGLGAIEERPVAEDGDVVARQTLPLSLSIDHRIVDGADAAAFTNDVMGYLETPSLLLLK